MDGGHESFQEYKIGGVSVLFPCKPYPSQFSMMDKIIKGIERHQNCLLESPTGSGKSLALLCSTLAWQKAEKAKFLQEEDDEQRNNSNVNCCCPCHTGVPVLHNNSCQDVASSCAVKNVSPYFEQITGKDNSVDKIVIDDDDDDDDDFKQDVKVYRIQSSKNDGKNLRKHVSIAYENGHGVKEGTLHKPDSSVVDSADCNPSETSTPESCPQCSCKNSNKPEKTFKRKIPKIYFGTRTHKQVAQIVRELKKTAYHDTRMTILASREHTCIHPVVSRSSAKNEGCQDLLNGPGCSLNEKAKRVSSHLALNSFGLTGAWDLEDIVEVLKKKKACPYFVTKGLKDTSDLIICPYNYLVDPVIRKSMELNLKHSIVILDEGHNIEDSAREAGSQTIMDYDLSKVITELDVLIEANIKLADHLKIKTMCSHLERFIHQESENLEQKDFDKACKIWSGFDIVAQLKHMMMGPDDFKDLLKSYTFICEDDEDQFTNHQGENTKLKSASRQVLEQIFTVLEYMYRQDLKYVEDYRVSVVRTTSYNRKPKQPTNAVWLMSRRNRSEPQNNVEVNFSLNFWCMNPAVSFSDFVACRCLILTSGTLSPMSSFQSELGLDFPIQLEANHVIKDDQIWVGAIGQGPKGSSLQAVYRNVDTFVFQDELGELILRVCETVPHGVLCFLSSYNMLEKVRERWKATDLWMKILQKKKIISEPRASDKIDFEELMKYFYKVIETGEDSDNADEEGGTDGALFLAVCRGKVSEGLDFADNFARAVITVGIPYPNFKDIQVELKRKYNDQNRSRGLLSGSDWYEIQAFRALNQALGRCIRHRKDWGALILVDDRFVKNSQKYCKGLSKWVRKKTQPFHNFNQAMESLAMFTKTRIEASENEGPDTSFFPSTPGTHVSQQTKSLMSPSAPVSTKQSTTEFSSLSEVKDKKSSSTLASGISRSSTPVQASKTRSVGQTFFTTQAGKGCGQRNVLLEAGDSPMSARKGTPSAKKAKPLQGHSSSNNKKHVSSADSLNVCNMKDSKSANNTSMVSDNECEVSSKQNVSAVKCENDVTVILDDEPEKTGDKPEAKKMATPHKKSGQEINKFFKFFKMSTTQNDKADAAVISASATENKSDGSGNIETKALENSPKHENVSTTEKSAESPLLFEGSFQDREKQDSLLNSNNNNDMNETSVESCKKPLFRKIKLGLGLDSEQEVKKEETGADTENVEIRIEAETKTEVGGDVKSENVNSSGEEDFAELLVKRRSSRKLKRKSMNLSKPGKKRQKGVEFLDSSETSSDKKCQIQCSACGKVLVDDAKGCEKTKRIPSFLQSILNKQNRSLIHFTSSDLPSNLQIKTAEGKSGMCLNCHWEEGEGVCVQFLTCSLCDVCDIIGCRVVFSTGVSQFETGQIWLLDSMVKWV